MLTKNLIFVITKNAENDSKQNTLARSLEQSSDAFPMHLIMLRSDIISKICKTDINPIAHVKVMRVAGRSDMVYIDDLVVRKVGHTK